MTDTIHAQLAAALRKQAQAAERELWARHHVEDCGRYGLNVKAQEQLDAAVIVTQAACEEVASLILSLHQPKEIHPDG